MPEIETPAAPAPDAPATPPPAPATPAPGTPPAAPTWDGPFDPDRAARLVENLRADLAAERAKRTAPAPEVAELKSQLDTLSAELTRTRLDAARADAVAAAKVPAHLAQYVSGSTPEEIKASAEKVAADFAAAAGQPAEAPPALPGLPAPAPTSGRAPADATPAFDPVATARAARGY